MKESDFPYCDTDIDFENYFEDIIGVTLNESKTEIIEFEVVKKLWNYIETKPLHGSQKKKAFGENEVVFTLDVIPNFELEKLILSFGEEMEVISPQHFREKIKLRIEKSSAHYD